VFGHLLSVSIGPTTSLHTFEACMVLDVRNLKTYFYTAAGVVRAVDGISYSVRPGETIALVGESGCGKSVSALSVMRLVSAPAGRIVGGQILFQGRDLLALDEESMRHIRGREIAMIFQEPMTSLNPVLSIGRQLTEPLEIHLDMPPDQARQQAVDLLATVGIPDPERRLTQYPHQFSGGMRQRMMIAMALACNPALVLADEPTTALDVTIQAQILELMKDLNPLHPYTRALLSAVPIPDPEVEAHRERIVLRGEVPSPLHPPPGCVFHPRCPIAVAECAQVVPELREVQPGHQVACIRV
jgi:oligopeptide/dipeptide ABC transporter ATP-binding protein